MRIISIPILLSCFLIFYGCSNTDKNIQIRNGNIGLEFNDSLHSRVANGYLTSLPDTNKFTPSEFLTIDNKTITDFAFERKRKYEINDESGKGICYEMQGMFKSSDLAIMKIITVIAYMDFPDMLITKTKYINRGMQPLQIQQWSSNHYAITNSASIDSFWSFQGGSYETRPDWVLSVKGGFTQENFQGMNATDYGGGIPVVDIWRRDGGVAIGSASTKPTLISLPVKVLTRGHFAYIGINKKININLAPEAEFVTDSTFLSVHKGDFFTSLDQFSKYMQTRGISFSKIPESAHESVWCAWGYERNFNVTEVLATLPKVKELGFKWVVLDDGWQTAEGDWFLHPDKFPAGDKDMQKFVGAIHQLGMKSKLWWAPLAVDPGTELHNNNPEYLLLNADGSTQDISWWDSYYLCPAYPPVLSYTKKLVKQIMETWGFRGLKIDGQHLNSVPPCYNPAHNHPYPEIAVESVLLFFKMIHETAHSIYPDAVVEICPCGATCSFYIMPYMDQPVSSDPMSSWQIRLKGKTIKALMGPRTAYYGDHVELSDNSTDFASSLGIGAVVGTKFTWPHDSHAHDDYLLTHNKEIKWRKWLQIFSKYELSKGEYLGRLYDIGFDKPETHVIRKENSYFYAFYAEKFKGKVEIRGLPHGEFKVLDYINNAELGLIGNDKKHFNISFEGHLLLKLDATVKQ